MYFISSSLTPVLFGEAPPKPYQNHHLDSIRLLMDGFVSAKKNRIYPDPKHWFLFKIDFEFQLGIKAVSAL